MKLILKRVLLYIIKILNRLVIKKEYISFSSIPDFSDNSQALFDYMLKSYPSTKFKIVWHIMDNDNRKYIQKWIEQEYAQTNSKILITKKYSLRSMWLFIKSKTIIDTHGLYNFKVKRQVEIQLWHGMLLKKIGYLRTDAHVDKKNNHGVYYTVNSEIFKPLFAKAFNADEGMISVCGQPRNDYLYDSKKVFDGDIKYIIYMPTFRRANGKYSFGMQDCSLKENQLFNLTREEWDEINRILKIKNVYLVVKPHPSDKLQNMEFLTECNMVKVINDKWLLKRQIPLYRLVAGSDALVTDYSSIYIDYLLTNKPICFFIPDFEEYKNNRGFVFDDVKKTMAGDICLNCKQLLEFIDGYDKGIHDYSDIQKIMNDIRQPVSSANIIDKYKDYLF